MDVALAIAAVRLLDGPDAEVAAYLVPDETLQPVCGIEHDRLEVVGLVPQRSQCGGDVGKAFRQRELGGVDLAEPVLGLDEDRVRGRCAEEAFAHAFLSVYEQSRRTVLLAFGDGAEQ